MKQGFLVGDIGGTKTVLAIVAEGNAFERIETFASKEFSSLEEVIKKFLGKEHVSHAYFGVAGPVKDGVCPTTNLPWIVSEKTLSLSIPHVVVLNDLIATAHAIKMLQPSQLYTLYQGDPSPFSNQAILSPGTGLGEALLIFDEKRAIPIPSEGGHTDFAPKSERDIALYRHLKEKFSHVSYERILSGPGIEELYCFLTQGDRKPASFITQEALLEKPSASKTVIHWFCEILGAEAGNLALKGYTLGGIFIGGGIAPKIIDPLKEGHFLRSFIDKGRFSPLLKTISVSILLDPLTPIYGLISLHEKKSS